MALFRKPFGTAANNPLGIRWRQILSNVKEAAKELREFSRSVASYANTQTGEMDWPAVAAAMGMDEAQIAEWKTMMEYMTAELTGVAAVATAQGQPTWTRVLLDQQG